MTRAAMCFNRGAGLSGSSNASFSASKDQAIVLLVVAQLADAQFVRADQAASERLWQEVAALDLDIERIINLLYCGVDPNDREALRAEDKAWWASNGVGRPQRWSLGGWRVRRFLHQPRPAACVS